MKKHNNELFNSVCIRVGIKPTEYIPGSKTEVSRELFDDLVKGCLKYFKQHKNAYKEIGAGKFTNSEIDLRRLSIGYILKFGLYFKEKENGKTT